VNEPISFNATAGPVIEDKQTMCQQPTSVGNELKSQGFSQNELGRLT
jgi:hypothetical protein